MIHMRPIYWHPMPPRPIFWPGFWLYCNSYWYDYHVTNVEVVHRYVQDTYNVDMISYAISGNYMYAIVRDNGTSYLQVFDQNDKLLAEHEISSKYIKAEIDRENGGCWIFKKKDKDPCELPPSIITRLPFRTCYDMDYFSDTWQDIPTDSYDAMFHKLLDHPNIHMRLNIDFAEIRSQLSSDTIIIYTGMPDALFDYKYGELEWRSLDFEWERVPVRDFQGTSVMNYADADVPYTRIHEFKHYHPERKEPYACNSTVICREYPATWSAGREAYYPVNDERNTSIYAKYAAEAATTPHLILGGRLGAYRYWDMDKAIDDALHVFDTRIRPQEVTL